MLDCAMNIAADVGLKVFIYDCCSQTASGMLFFRLGSLPSICTSLSSGTSAVSGAEEKTVCEFEVDSPSTAELHLSPHINLLLIALFTL